MSNVTDVSAVIDFWFGTIRNGWTETDRSALWFNATKEDDARLRQHFAKLHSQAAKGALDAWHASAQGSLALILILDQFSRQLQRGTKDAFAHDDKALALAKDGVKRGWHQQLPLVCRQFYYLPWQHSEQLRDQEESLLLYAALLAEASDPHHSRALQCAYAFAQEHHDLIARFGRFPHRNAIMQRANTKEEEAYLQKEGGSNFGQSTAS